MSKPRIVKIDEHIKKSTKREVPSKVPGKRGRPRKTELPEPVSSNVQGAGAAPSSVSPDRKLDGTQLPSSGNAPQTGPAVIPAFDTTPQARAFIQGPFALVAMMLGDNDLALSNEESDIITPVFKPVYDEDILPTLGPNSKYWNLASILAGVVGKKYMNYRRKHPKMNVPTYHVEPTPPTQAQAAQQPHAGASVSPAFPGIPVERVL